MIRNTEIVLVAYYKTESCFLFFSYFYCFEPVVKKKKNPNKQKFLYWLKKTGRLLLLSLLLLLLSLFICYFDVNTNGCGGGLYL